MAISLKHLFQSAKTDGPDNTIVQPSDWNDEHVLTQATGKILGRTTAGAGATEEISPGTGITLSAGTISADVTSVAGRTGAVTLSTADISGLTTGYVQKTSSTGAAALPASTTGDRPGTPLAGYIRYNSTTGKFEGYGSAWGNIGGGAAIGDTPPANPGAGDLWWESDLGRMFVYYSDGNSSQWVDISAGGAGQYLPLTGGDVTGQITTTGNIGVGYATPAYRLHVVGSPANGILQYNANSAVGSTKSRIGFQDASTTYAPDLGSVGNNITFETVGAERARITSGGDFLVGTTTSGGKFTLSWNNSTQQGFVFTAQTTTFNGSPVVFYNSSGGLCGFIGQTASSVSYNTSSDYRLKENVQPIQNALEKVALLNPVTYTWKADGSAGQGFIAHELQEVVPDCVTGEKDAVDVDGNPRYQGVDASKLVATLTKAIQELNAKVDALQSELNAIKGGE